MALNFPDNPSLNDTYRDSTSGFTYTWNGTVWISTVDRKIGNIKQVDDISASFDGSEAVFDFLCNGEVIAPLETNKTIVSLGGVLQNPGDDYSVFGTQITFSTPPTNGLTFFAQVLQTDQSKSTLPNASVGPEALSTGGFSWNSSGDFIVSGILTSGTSSVTLDGDANQITVGTAGTINESGIDIVGIVTAGSYVGDGSNLEGVTSGIGTTGSVNTSGIITATSFTGDGRNLTDVGGYLAGLIYNPGIGATQAATDTGIGITFTKSITKNTGVINLRENSISGTIAESYDIATVGSSSTIAISGATLTITPDSTLGTGTTYFVEVPANIVRDTYDTGGNLGITSFTFETSSTTALNSYELWAWGYTLQGNLGLNDRVNRSSPVQLPGTQWSIVSSERATNVGGHHAIKSDRTLWGWGSSAYSGLNVGYNVSSPTQMPGTAWNSVSGWRANLATKTDGTIWSWGPGGFGALGHDNEIPFSSPRQIPGTSWSNKTAHNVYGCYAIKTDGTLWTWGVGNNGQLGINDTSPRSSPVQIPGSWVEVRGGQYRGLATKTDGTLWQWGRVSGGESGTNDNIDRSSPYQIPGTQWDTTRFDAGLYTSAAFKTDGTLWVWGWNNHGQLGLNEPSSLYGRSSPTQIPGTSWNNLGMGFYYGTATKTDGTLWAWGYNNDSQLGQNDRVNRSSPTQIPGTKWQTTSGSYGSSFALKTP